MQYYAITSYNTTKLAPFALVRFNNGLFEVFQKPNWKRTDRYNDILIGEFNDFDILTEVEAAKLVEAILDDD